MDWLNKSELTRKKQQLRPTTTTITRADGVQYVEPKPEIQSPTQTRQRPDNLILNRGASCAGYVVDERPDLNIGLVTPQIMIGKQTVITLCQIKCLGEVHNSNAHSN